MALLASVVLTFAITVPLSILTYKFIEAPGIALGKSLGARWKDKGRRSLSWRRASIHRTSSESIGDRGRQRRRLTRPATRRRARLVGICQRKSKHDTVTVGSQLVPIRRREFSSSSSRATGQFVVERLSSPTGPANGTTSGSFEGTLWLPRGGAENALSPDLFSGEACHRALVGHWSPSPGLPPNKSPIQWIAGPRNQRCLHEEVVGFRRPLRLVWLLPGDSSTREQRRGPTEARNHRAIRQGGRCAIRGFRISRQRQQASLTRDPRPAFQGRASGISEGLRWAGYSGPLRNRADEKSQILGPLAVVHGVPSTIMSFSAQL